MHRQLNPLDLPHILDAIFAALDPYLLRHNVRLVNRQWRTFADRHLEPISAVNTWDLTHTEEELAQFLDTLPNRTLLKISQRGLPDVYQGLSLIQRLGTLQQSSDNNNIRFRSLHLVSVPCSELWIYISLLPLLGSFLTDIRITGSIYSFEPGNSYQPIPLGIILHRCPHLRNIYISATEGPCDIGHNTNLSGSGSSVDLKDLGTLKLEEFELVNMNIPQTTLEAVITHAPRLRVLRLVELYRSDTSNRVIGGAPTGSRIVDLAAESCPNLQVFHYSLRWQRLSTNDVVGLTSVTKQGVQCSGTLHRIHLTSPNDVVDQLRDLNLDKNHADRQDRLTTHTLSLYHYHVQPIIAPCLRPIINVVTTLEIHPMHHPPGLDVTVNFTRTLHKFLCSSPLLLHLKAPLVRFHSAFLDLRGEENSQGLYQALPAVPYYQSHQQFIFKMIWACRRLVTLHIYSSGEQVQFAEEDSRIVFGYISRICPLLQDLAIQHQHLCVRLEGGLCLLSRLHHLERLSVISSGNNSGFTKADLVWMKKSPPPTQSLPRFREPMERHTEYRRQLGHFFQRSLTTFSRVDPDRVQEMHRLYVKAKNPNQQLTVEDMDGVGSVEDLEAWRQFRQGYRLEGTPGRANAQEDGDSPAPTKQVDLPYCWPSLKYFAFYRYQTPAKIQPYGLHRQEDLDALDQALWDEIKDIRPGVEMKCNRGLYYNAIYNIGIYGNPTHLASYGKAYVDV
ncbi:hypothetical protein EC991_000155 [Linnemannia zychae]|nr:hypothetical protein EC991_000155 [Linnemannia zychae]